MKPSKKRAAKRPSNPMVTKLLNLKYRINEAYCSGNVGEEGTKNDKSWVMDKIKYLKYGDGKTLTKGEMLHCNNLWKEYSPSRLNDWVSYKND